MRVIITGGAGFLGTLLARQLLAEPVTIGGRTPEPVTELVLADLVVPQPDLAADRRVRALAGELQELLPYLGDADCVFHLAGVVSAAAEADFDLGMRTNIDGLLSLLEWCRARPVPPVLVFSSSLAVYGVDPAVGRVGVVDDDTLPRPQSSYGIQKFIGEQLVADYTRKGFVRGRSVRLMTVVVRPGTPNAAVSSFVSSIIRGPLAGERAPCPVPADTEIALSSARRTVGGIMRSSAVDDTTWGSHTAMNLPALTTTPQAMGDALDRVTGEPMSDLITWRVDPTTTDIVGGWPSSFETSRARDLGLRPDPSFDHVLRAYLSDLRSPTNAGPVPHRGGVRNHVHEGKPHDPV